MSVRSTVFFYFINENVLFYILYRNQLFYLLRSIEDRSAGSVLNCDLDCILNIDVHDIFNITYCDQTMTFGLSFIMFS